MTSPPAGWRGQARDRASRCFRWVGGGVRAVVRPSLLRRLLIAQMLLLMLMWTLGIAYLLSLGGRSFLLLEATRLFEAINLVADDLEQAPDKRQRLLDKMHETIVEDYGGRPERWPTFVVVQHGQVVYRTRYAPSALPPQPSDQVSSVQLDGTLYRSRTLRADSGTQVTMFAPDDGWNVLRTVYSDGFYFMPLLTCLPFLVIPAWVSIRLAMRPWTEVAREVKRRGPKELQPLRYRDSHQELAIMVDAINGWMLRVAASSERERCFVADAAHELRTPLAAMMVNVQVLDSRARDDREHQLMAGILSSGHRATRVVNQLLSLMRSEASEADAAEGVELERLLQDRLAALAPLAALKGAGIELQAEVEAEPGLRVLASPTALASLVDNLVENAIKYGPRGGVIRVDLRRQGDLALLVIEDEGPGIPPALRERVFDRFYRDPSQREPGSGLGLAIVRAVLRRLEGQIRLADGDSGGLSVEVSMPLAP